MIYISPWKITRFLTFVVLGLTLACVAGQFSKYVLGYPRLLGFVRQFDFNSEANIPTWYSSSTLLICSLLLALIASAKKIEGDRYVRHWGVLSFIFLFLSLDESASIHEMANKLRPLLQVSGFLYFAWVIPYAAIVLIFVLAYLRFLLALPAKTRLLFLLAGSLYVGGAIGIELVEARYVSFYGESIIGQDMMFAVMTIVEEFLEMLGIVVFIYALLSYIRLHMKDLRVRIDDEKA